MLLLLQATQAADSVQVAADELMKEAIANADGLDKLSLITQQLIDFGIRAGERILIAVLVFVVGRFLISLLNKFIRRLLDKRKVDVSIKTFVRSLVNILLTILLIISVVGALGVETTSFAALLASAGVAVGMALSGNLQNFAGGLVILLFKPYKVGDWIETQQGSAGTVKEIQIISYHPYYFGQQIDLYSKWFIEQWSSDQLQSSGNPPCRMDYWYRLWRRFQ